MYLQTYIIHRLIDVYKNTLTYIRTYIHVCINTNKQILLHGFFFSILHIHPVTQRANDFVFVFLQSLTNLYPRVVLLKKAKNKKKNNILEVLSHSLLLSPLLLIFATGPLHPLHGINCINNCICLLLSLSLSLLLPPVCTYCH